MNPVKLLTSGTIEEYNKPYILIFFFETTWPIRIKLYRNVHWVVFYKFIDFYPYGLSTTEI
jgi:hypothetical protein